MEFSIIEKLAVVKSLDELILANEEIDQGELEFLEKVMKELSVRKEIIEESRELRSSDCLEILRRMDNQKKQVFTELLHQMAIADGYADELEINLIIALYDNMGLNKNEEILVTDYPNLNYQIFPAKKQFVFPDGFSGERHLLDEEATIKIESEILKTDLYNVTIFKEALTPKLWNTDVVFPTRKMTFLEQNKQFLELATPNQDQTIQIYYLGPEILKIRFTDSQKGIFIEYV